MRKDRTISPQDYLHPMDRALSQKITDLPFVGQILDRIFQEKLDAVNSYLYQSSCMKLPDSHAAAVAFHDGCRRFGLNIAENVYVVRSYDFDVRVVGYTDPVVLVPSRLMEDNHALFLEERTAVAAAAIAAGHPKLDFLLWIYENFNALWNLPVIHAAAAGLVNEWRRSRYYTLDRAFFLYTNHYPMALENILYGTVPYPVLENFDFGGDDTYSIQVDDFYRIGNATDVVAAVSSVLQCEIWLPERYEELRKFCRKG